MEKYQRILLATDFSPPAQKALVEALRLAQRHDAELHILYVDLLGGESVEGFDFPDRAKTLAEVDRAALALTGQTGYAKTVTAVVRDMSETGGILRYAKEKDVDLIVLGTHGRNAFAEAVLGSVAQHVARTAPVSVLVVGKTAPDPRAPRVILAPTDFSATAKASLRRAGAIAAEEKARLIALHVVDFDRVPGKGYRSPHAHEQNMHDQLPRFIAEAHPAVEPEPMLMVGTASEQIVKVAAARKATLIVIAPSGHTPLERFLLGSVCREVLRDAPCPVLVHREREPAAARREAA